MLSPLVHKLIWLGVRFVFKLSLLGICVSGNIYLGNLFFGEVFLICLRPEVMRCRFACDFNSSGFIGRCFAWRCAAEMAGLAASSRLLLLAIARFQSDAVAVRDHPRTADSLQVVLQAMEQDGCDIFDVRGAVSRFQLHKHKLACTLWYWKKKAQQIKQEFKVQMCTRVGGQIAKMWFVRVAFSPPGVPLRALSSFCRDFPCVEQAFC